MLQHRGQDTAGIVTMEEKASRGHGSRFHERKAAGLIATAIDDSHMKTLKGTMGIANCRFPDSDDNGEFFSPFFVNAPLGE